MLLLRKRTVVPIAEKYISLEHYFVDITKIGGNASRYTFVCGKPWTKNTEQRSSNNRRSAALLTFMLLKLMVASLRS